MNFMCRPDGPYGIVFVCFGYAEKRQDSIACESLDETIVFFDDLFG